MTILEADFSPKAKSKILLVKRVQKPCRCLQILVDERAGTLTCKTCKSLVDPIQWIIRATQSWAVTDEFYHARSAELGKIEEELKKAKAQLRYARGKL